MASEPELPIDALRRVIDFSAFGIDKAESQLQRQHFDRVARQMWDGFASDGFVYLKNHGIDETEIARLFAAADSFFDLPLNVKIKYHVQKDTFADDQHGYVPIDGERLENAARTEHRESFNVTSTEGPLPEMDSPGFTAAVDRSFRSCSLLALRVLKTIAIALKLEEEDFFTKTHLPFDIKDNYTCLRLINYPPATPEEVQTGSVRCGEHSDYGSLTLLFQDEIGGLEAKVRSGEYVHIMPIPGTVVVNIGNILEHMTSGQLLSVRHRVLLRGNTERQNKKRRAVAFFVHPADEVLVQRLTGPQDPHPSNSRDFVKPQFESTYRV